MAEATLNVRILPCSHTSEEWASDTYKNKKLKEGEIGYERNTGRYKIGNGSSTWSELPWGAATPYTHNHTSLTGMTSIGFSAHSSDVLKIMSTIDNTNTYLDFYVSDDEGDGWRWRFKFYNNEDTINAMTLIANKNGGNLNVNGNVTATAFYGVLNGNAQSASQASCLKLNTSCSYDDMGVSWFDINGVAGAAAGVNDTPTTAWWHILRFNHQNSNGYYTDLAIPFGNTSLYYKRVRSAAVDSNEKWVRVLDALNYNSYALPLTGGKVTGTTTISSPNFGALWIERSGSTNMASIGFKNNNGNLGYIAMNALDGSLVRYKGSDTSNYYPFLDSANYTNYTVTKTGAGASGTWGINISGNAATATKATSATKADNSALLDSWGRKEFYNEFFGHRWNHLTMENTSDNRTGWYKVADVKMTSGYGSYYAAKIVGYLYDHQGNWEQTETLIIPFQAIFDITNDYAYLYTTPFSENHIRILKTATRTWELQVTCNQAHCDFDVFYQVVSNKGVTNYVELVAGSTDGTLVSQNQTKSWGNYAYRAARDWDGNTISSTYLKLSGGTITGQLFLKNTQPFVFYGFGSGNYTRGCMWSDSSGIIFETPRASEDVNASPLGFYINTRGGTRAPLHCGALNVKGNETITNTYYPTIYFKNTYNKKYSMFEGSYVGEAGIWSVGEGGETYRRSISVYDPQTTPDLKNALKLRMCNAGTWSSYNVLHEGHFSLSGTTLTITTK